MSNDIAKYQKIYDDTYDKLESYNFFDEIKNVCVDIYAAFVEGKILDAGCGEGIHLKRLLSKGYNVFGIELSTVCCEKFLQGLPHQNADIVSFAKQQQQFAGIICMDVLEHVPYENIEETIGALKFMAPSVLLGIANHSDVINGVELHVIQQKSDWWINLLNSCYEEVTLVEELYDGNFFFIECSNVIGVDTKKYKTKIHELMRICADVQKQIKQEKINVIKVAQEKEGLEYELALLRQHVCALQQEKDAVEQEKIALSHRYKYLEKFRKSDIGRGIFRCIKGR